MDEIDRCQTETMIHAFNRDRCCLLDVIEDGSDDANYGHIYSQHIL